MARQPSSSQIDQPLTEKTAFSRIGAIIVLILLFGVIGSAIGQPPTAPSTLLEGATIPRAKAMALDAALLKGWHLADTGADYARFETPLDAPTSAGPPDARSGEPILLRIHAYFSPVQGGAMASLRAEEVWRAGSPHAWTRDITAAFRGHLERALSSLQAQWSRFLAAQPGTLQRDIKQTASFDQSAIRPLDPNAVQQGRHGQARSTPSPSANVSQPARSRPTSGTPRYQLPPSAAVQPPQPVGVWAYDAERLAQRLGCQLTDRGAILTANSGTVETHLVACSNRAAMRVRCDRQRCRR
jgi:hypothetical protein